MLKSLTAGIIAVTMAVTPATNTATPLATESNMPLFSGIISITKESQCYVAVDVNDSDVAVVASAEENASVGQEVPVEESNPNEDAGANVLTEYERAQLNNDSESPAVYIVLGRENLTQLDVDSFNLLCKAVEAEVGIESFASKEAVAESILNRVCSTDFANSIYNVLYEKNQFSTASNGAISKATISNETRNACKQALLGQNHPSSMVYFRASYYHAYGRDYTRIDNTYFSLQP